MKIEQVTIKNYKSIKEIYFEPTSGLNSFIGANSTGKSNIFDAINWLLGPMYPSFNSVKKEDHFLGDEGNKIYIKLSFDDGNSLEFDESKEVTNYGKKENKSGLFYNDEKYNCKSEIREKYCSAYLGVDRKIMDYLPSNRWSLVGRVLLEVNKKFQQESYEQAGVTKKKTEWLKEWLTEIKEKLLFSVEDENGEKIMTKFQQILQTESANQLNKSESDFKVDLSLYDPWNFYRTLQLLVTEQDMNGLEFQASSLGMGVQASISIAILKAYSEINLANKSPIFIDEPELYLHPQAQRNFYKLLRDLSEDKLDDEGNIIREGTQIFFTTHSPNFLSAGNFNEIFIVRKNADKGTYVCQSKTDDFVVDLEQRKGIVSSNNEMLLHFKNAYENTGDTQKANEAFFAKKIILVGGQSESLILPYLFDLIEFDYLKEGVSIVRCGGKSELDRFYRLYTELQIPCYLIFDGDFQLSSTSEKNENINRNKAIMSLFGSTSLEYPENKVNDLYLGFEYFFEKNLGFTTTKKGLDLYVEVKLKITDKSQVSPWVEEVRVNLDKFTDLPVKSVLIKKPETI